MLMLIVQYFANYIIMIIIDSQTDQHESNVLILNSNLYFILYLI